MEKVKSVYLPIRIRSGFGSQSRQKFIQQSKQYIPDLFKGRKKKTGEKYHCEIRFYIFGDNTSEGAVDIDNAIKAVLDSIKKRLIWDDNQIISLSARILERSKRMGVGIDLYTIQTK